MAELTLSGASRQDRAPSLRLRPQVADRVMGVVALACAVVTVVGAAVGFW